MANSYLTEQDVQDYGPDLVNLAQRASLHAVAPELQNLQQQNEALRQQVARELRHRLDSQVAAAVPDFRQIDRNPDWHSWLCGIDALSGEIRQRLLNAAIQRGDANSVIAFFRGYQRESGNQSSGSSAATTSGRTRSTSSPRGRVYTRDEVSRLYRQHQQGAYVGQEAAWRQQEADIIRAGAEGRIQNPVDVFGK